MADLVHPVNSVQRALAILAVFTERTPELGMTEIAGQLGLHKSTAAGLIYTLEANGYLAQNPKTRKYRLGMKLVERAGIVLNGIEIRQLAFPYLQELRDQYDETVNLAVLDGPDVVYVDRLLSTRVLSMRAEVGKRMLAHSTALGKAMLAFMSPLEVEAHIRLHGLKPVTPRTVTDPQCLRALLEQVRNQGYAFDDEENEPGGRCVAAPIFDYAGRPTAAVSISAPVSRMAREDIPSISVHVGETARAISRRLGYTGASY